MKYMSKPKVKRNDRWYELHQSGKTVREIAELSGVHWTTVHGVIQRIHWEEMMRRKLRKIDSMRSQRVIHN